MTKKSLAKLITAAIITKRPELAASTDLIAGIVLDVLNSVNITDRVTARLGLLARFLGMFR